MVRSSNLLALLIKGSRFKVQSSKFKVQSSKFKDQGVGGRVESSKFKLVSSKDVAGVDQLMYDGRWKREEYFDVRRKT